MYLTYCEYRDMGGVFRDGAINAELFPSREARARAVLDVYTFNRLRNDKHLSENVKRCMVELVDVLSKQHLEVTGQKDVKAQSNDGVSITYTENKTPEEYDTQIRQIIIRYLLWERNEKGVDLLYRGAGG